MSFKKIMKKALFFLSIWWILPLNYIWEAKSIGAIRFSLSAPLF